MRLRVLFFLALFGSAALRPCRATTLVRLSLEQLSQASTHVVRGHAVRQESRWNPEHTRIVTLTTVAVDQVFKGRGASTVVIEQLGGTVGHIRSYVPGTVRFFPLTDYVLFLEPSASNPSRFLIVGMRQGAFRIYRDAMSREERVIEPLGNFLSSSRRRETPAKTAAPTAPLAEFRQQVAEAVSTPLAIPSGSMFPVAIDSTEPRGAGRVRVMGRVISTVYPSPGAVIPAGSSIEGTAELVAGVWTIRWTELSVRGARVRISATSEQPRGSSLSGKVFVVSVR